MIFPPSFLSANTPFESARVVIVGVPLERTTSFRGGPRWAPAAVRLASNSLETYSALFEQDLSQVGICDLGDLWVHGPLPEVLRRLGEEVKAFLRAGKAPVLIGGEHTLTLGAVQGAAAASGGLQILALDAHSDLRDEYAGERICHATVLRRAAEVADRLVIVGARSFFGPEVNEPTFALPEGFTAHLDVALPLWLTVDLDVLDPALCPGVTNPEPGGLSYAQVIEIFRKLRGFQVVGMDVVELAPPFDPTGTGAVVAAKLLLEAICAFWAPKRPCG